MYFGDGLDRRARCSGARGSGLRIQCPPHFKVPGRTRTASKDEQTVPCIITAADSNQKMRRETVIRFRSCTDRFVYQSEKLTCRSELARERDSLKRQVGKLRRSCHVRITVT